MPAPKDLLAWTPTGPVRAYGLAHPKPSGVPCCTLVAAWVLGIAGYVPEDVTSWRAWRAVGPSKAWWNLANIANEQWTPWDSLTAAREILGGEIDIQDGADAPGPRLTPDRWHVVQWWRPGLTSGGHTTIWHRAALGEAPYYGNRALRCVQSSIAKGYRDEGVDQFPPYPRVVSVLTLPEGL